MGIKIWQGSHVFNKEESVSIECFHDEKMQGVFYTLKAKECINIVPDDYCVSTIILIEEGCIKVCSKDETFILHAHDSILLTDIDISYIVEAQEFTKLIAISSEINQDPEEDKETSEMLKAVEEKDVYTMGHSKRVALYAKRLALGYESTYHVISLSAAASMHDIGKIYTPISILRKPGKLTDEEFEIIKRHPVDSYELLKVKFGERVASAALQHHERLDGSGYPYGLSGNQIGLDARIIAIADVFDAMTCKRIYNEPRSMIEVVKYLEENLDKYDASIIGILRRKVENHEMDDVLSAFH